MVERNWYNAKVRITYRKSLRSTCKEGNNKWCGLSKEDSFKVSGQRYEEKQQHYN